MILLSRNLVRNYILLILVIFAGSIFSVHSTVFKLNSDTIVKKKPLFPSSSQSYAVHAPILITSDGGFSSYNFSGVGTRNDPYLIEGYNITSHGWLSFGIEIRNTNAFFVINSCVIYADYIGVGLRSVRSGSSKIVGNRIISLIGDGGGITLNNMQNCTISDNICTNFMHGIHLNGADDCIIYDNYLYNIHDQGISIRSSDSNSITYNQIKNSAKHGIALIGTSNSNVIHHNILEENAWSDSYNIDGTQINERPTSQGYDEGSDNIWYDSESKEGNAWSDYFGVGPYQIDGPSNAVDLYPSHTTGLTLLVIIISIASITIGIVGALLIYRFYYKKRK